MNPIGYYNPFSYPVSFTGSKGQLVEVSPGVAVTGNDGKLINSDRLLDEQVANGSLKRIYDSDPKWANHDAIVEKRSRVAKLSGSEASKLPLSTLQKVSRAAAKVASPASPPVTTIDAKSGVKEQPETSKAIVDPEPLPEGVTEDGGILIYKGMKFSGRPALNAYLSNVARK